MRQSALMGWIWLLFTALPSYGQSPYVNPLLELTPALPGPLQPVIARVYGASGVEAIFDENEVSRIGFAIEIRTSITLGFVQMGHSYSISDSLGQLDAGIYTLTFVSRTREGNAGQYSAYFVERVWRFAVLESGQLVTIVEFYNAQRGHFFLTGNASEIAALDDGTFVGWSRTGQSFMALASSLVFHGRVPICRFYGRPSAGLDTHFFAAYQQECDYINNNWSAAWIIESADAFGVSAIDLTTGECPVNLVPIYRLFNGRPDINHRYTKSVAIQSEMTGIGWFPEGSGSPPAVWCVVSS